LLQQFPCSPLLALIEQLPLEQLQARHQLLLKQLDQLLHQPQSASLAEDILAVLSALLDRLSSSSGDKMSTAVGGLLFGRLLPQLTAQFLSSPSVVGGDNNTTLLAAIGLTGDIYRVMAGASMTTLFDHEAVVMALMGHLQGLDCSPGLAIASFVALADMALCLRSSFRPYAEVILRLLAHTAHWEALAAPPSSLAGEAVAGSLAEMHKCLADTYSSILQAMQPNDANEGMENYDNNNRNMLEGYLPGMLALLDRASHQNRDQPINDDLLLSLCGLIGDIYQVLVYLV
jgi:hypothetical protein